MKAIKHRDFIKELKAFGVEKLREGKGSHTIYKLGDRQTSIPFHRVIAAGTRRDIYKDLELEYK